MRIDSHQHFWSLARNEYPWMSPSMAVLCRDYLPGDLRPLLAEAGIHKTIAVQAATSVEETRFLLEFAHSPVGSFVAGVVGWLDFEGDDFASQLEQLRGDPKLVGLRPAIEFIPDDDWIARPRVIESIRRLADAGLALDLVSWPRHLPAALRMLDCVPGLRCVVDHLSKPDIKAHEREPWHALIGAVAAHPNVFCKLSGMVNQADHAAWSVADLRPYVQRVLELFGPERVMFGSDWPVCLLAATYAQTVTSLQEALGGTIMERWGDAIFGGNAGGNAARFYQLKV